MAHPRDEDDQRTALGAALLEARLRSGKSQEQVAREVGIVQGSVSNYERGAREPSLSIAGRLAESLGVDLRSLAVLAMGARDRRPD